MEVRESYQEYYEELLSIGQALGQGITSLDEDRWDQLLDRYHTVLKIVFPAAHDRRMW